MTKTDTWQTRPLVREGVPPPQKKWHDSNLQKKISGQKSQIGFDTTTYWLTDRQSQCDFDFEYMVSRHRRQWHVQSESSELQIALTLCTS
jgi:hypothetical protein